MKKGKERKERAQQEDYICGQEEAMTANDSSGAMGALEALSYKTPTKRCIPVKL